MNPFFQFAPHAVVAGLLLIFLGFTVLFGAKHRRTLRRVGIGIVAVGVIGLIILLMSAPGREKVDQEVRDDDTSVKPKVLSIQQKLELPWQANGYSSWPVAAVLVHLCKIGYQEPVDARTEFEKLGFKSETITSASMIGYVLAIGDTAVVLLRGTDDSADWVRNASFRSSQTADGTIHSGFYNAYQPLHVQIEKLLHRFESKQIWITGHSLGGALAVVASYQLTKGNNPPILGVMTFGQPMVVGSELKAFMKHTLDGKYVHFVNETDPVARLITPFEHFGTLLWLKEGVIYRSRGDRVSYGSSSDQTDEVPSFKSLSIDELEQLKSELERANESPQPVPVGTPIPVGASLPSVSDHYVDQYIRMIETISNPQEALKEVPLKEE